MKLLSTLGYLLVIAFKLPITSSQQKRNLEGLTGKGRNPFFTYIASITILLFGFVQFWLLTRRFPFALYLALAVALLITLMVQAVIGAAAGFTVGAKRQKIGVLSTVWGLQNMKLGCVIVASAAIILCFSTVAALWIFWTHPLGDLKAVGWIAFFELVVPQCVSTLLMFIMTGPTISSEFVDEDCRNSFLLGQFSLVITMVVALLYPFWIFKDELGTIFGFLPPLWLLLSLPFALFILGGVFPYFVGARKYRALFDELREWRKKWLNDVLPLLVLPVGTDRSTELDEMVKRLDDEIEERERNHDLFAFFQQLTTPNTEPVPEPSPQLALPANNNPAPATVADAADRSEPQILAAVQQFSPVPYIGGANPVDDPVDRIRDMIRKNKDHLVEWDISFGHISQLLHWRRVIPSAKTNDVTPFFKQHLSALELPATVGKKSAIWALIWTGLTAAAPTLFKIFEKGITDVITSLVNGH